MPDYQVTLSEGGSPNCAGIYTDAGEFNGQRYYTCTNETGTWFLWNDPTPGFGGWRISSDLGGGINPDDAYWRYPYLVGDYEPRLPATGTATVAEVIASDDEPDGFAFTGISDAEPSTVYTSESQTITGMDAGTAISITGGEYRINGGDWTSDTGEIDPDDTLELRTTSVATYGPKTVVVTVGSVSVSWTVSVPVKINFGLSLTGTVQVNFTR